jgi:hypothetical protein
MIYHIPAESETVYAFAEAFDSEVLVKEPVWIECVRVGKLGFVVVLLGCWVEFPSSPEIQTHHVPERGNDGSSFANLEGASTRFDMVSRG